MQRTCPEDIEHNPVSGEIYMVMTNNIERGPPDGDEELSCQIQLGSHSGTSRADACQTPPQYCVANVPASHPLSSGSAWLTNQLVFTLPAWP